MMLFLLENGRESSAFSTVCRFLCQKLKKGGGKVSLFQKKTLSLFRKVGKTDRFVCF